MLKRYATAVLTAAIIITCATVALAHEAKPDAAQTVLTTEQAQDALRAVLPDIRVLSIEPAILPGLMEVAFTSQGDTGVVYLDATKQYIVVGSLIGLTTGVNYTKKKFESLRMVDFSSIPLENSVILGDPEAEFKVVVFDDPD
ncbi:MAG: hypothetical protein KAR83_01345 [Thermodesulfovibrionales bacterium]|nr:hypothetical protein [Thermodesulfovibrionales bacterium]